MEEGGSTPHTPCRKLVHPLLPLSICIFSPAHRSEGTQLPASSGASPEPEAKSGEPDDSGTRSPDAPLERAWRSDGSSGNRALDEGLSLHTQGLQPGSRSVGCAHGPVRTDAAIQPPNRIPLPLRAELGFPSPQGPLPQTREHRHLVWGSVGSRDTFQLSEGKTCLLSVPRRDGLGAQGAEVE